MSNFPREEEIASTSFETCFSERTLSAVGDRFYRRNTSHVLSTASMDIDWDILLYEMDQGRPSQASNRHGNHSIPGIEYFISFWLPMQNRNRQRSSVPIQENDQLL